MFERSVSLSLLYLFLPGSRHTRFPRSFCPVPFHHRCRTVVCALPHPITRPCPLRRSPFCIARVPLLLTYPCSYRDFVGLYPRSLVARSLTVSSSVRYTFLSISPAGGTGGERGSLYKWFQSRTGAGVVFRVIGRRLCHAAAER